MGARKTLFLLATHLAVGTAGFAGGIYALPILTAPVAPTADDVQAVATRAVFNGRFKRDLKGSDLLHWGEGAFVVTPAEVALSGKLAPGPDYKLYLSPEFVETEADFLRVKPHMLRAGDVKTFENFVVKLPPGTDPAKYDTVVVWCESFGQFITAGKYR